MIDKTSSASPRYTKASILAASFAFLAATTAFRCPGPDPSSPDGDGGAGGEGAMGAGGTTTGLGGAGGSGDCGADLLNDPSNCGACGRACAAEGVDQLSCSGGICAPSCGWGYLDQSSPAAPLPDDGCETFAYRVFVTSQPVAADFDMSGTGALGADTVCQNAASAIGGVYFAWTSDPATSPALRFSASSLPGSGFSYVLSDNTVIADNWIDLTDDSLDHAIDQDENGGLVDADVWTGTGTDGALTSFYDAKSVTNCSNWSDPTNDFTGAVIGRTSKADFSWSEIPPQASFPICVIAKHLYCFEQ